MKCVLLVSLNLLYYTLKYDTNNMRAIGNWIKTFPENKAVGKTFPPRFQSFLSHIILSVQNHYYKVHIMLFPPCSSGG